MKYLVVPVTPFQQNCSILWCEATMRGAVVDPGGEIGRILQAAEGAGVEIEKIILTHGHLDHAGGTADLSERLGVPVEGPAIEDKYWIDGMEQQGRMFGVGGARTFTPDRWLVGGDTVQVGQRTLDVRPLSRPYAGPCDLLQRCGSAGGGRGCAVPGIDRPHRLSRRRL